PPGHLASAGHRVDHPLVEFVSDQDPERRAERRKGRCVERVAQCAAQKLVGRRVDGERLAQKRTRVDEEVDENEQPDEQRDGAPLVRLDVGVESVGGHQRRSDLCVPGAAQRECKHEACAADPGSLPPLAVPDQWCNATQGSALHRIRDTPWTHQNFTCGACSSTLRSSTPTSKKSFGVKPSGPASSTAGNCWMPVLYSCTARSEERRAAAILFSRSESWLCSSRKFWLALRSG